MFSKVILLAVAFAYVEARFGQEQVPIQAIAQLNAGAPGVAATIAGGAISNLLAAANPCDKLKTADNIIAQLGTSDDVVAAAIGFVAAEQNFNPFVTDRPTFCNDASLPTTEILRGITPLVDPAVDGADTANQLSTQSKTTPFDATGLSVAQVLAAQGFTNFDTKDAAGTAGPAGDGLGGGAAGNNAGAVNNGSSDNTGDAADNTATTTSAAASQTTSSAASDGECPQPVTVTVTGSAATATNTASSSDNAADSSNNNSDASGNTAGNTNTGSGVTPSTIAGLDFGLCEPTMQFLGGLGGRPATEFTFQAIDPLVAKGQQEALNPAIIVNRICDQLTNVCEANQAAKDACRKAQSELDATQRNAQTAVDWNTKLGFADAFTPAAAKRGLDAQRKRAIEGVKRRSARV